MKNWIPFLALLALSWVVFSCAEKDPQAIPLPPCIEQEVEAYKNASACGIDSARVTRYATPIGYVYLFSYAYCCCDYASPILDSDCNEVCFLDGFAGIQKCVVDSVELNLSNPVVIWEK